MMSSDPLALPHNGLLEGHTNDFLAGIVGPGQIDTCEETGGPQDPRERAPVALKECLTGCHRNSNPTISQNYTYFTLLYLS